MQSDPLEVLGLNLKMVQDSPQTWSINKSLAFKLSLQPTMPVGDFFKGLSDADLRFLVMDCDQVGTDDEAEMELMLLATMLSSAEGLVINDDSEELIDRCNVLVTLIVSESLRRKGLVNLKYENLSLGEDARDLVIASMTEEGNEFAKQLGLGDPFIGD